jgi:hypothetical protein
MIIAPPVEEAAAHRRVLRQPANDPNGQPGLGRPGHHFLVDRGCGVGGPEAARADPTTSYGWSTMPGCA